MTNVTTFRVPKQKTVKPPAGLRKRGREFWIALQNEYGIQDSAGLELLRQAAELLDRIEEARRAGKRLILRDRDAAPRTNPAWRVERDARAEFRSMLRALNLDIEEPKPVGRPRGA